MPEKTILFCMSGCSDITENMGLRTVHMPQSDIVVEPKKTIVDRKPTEVVLYERNAMRAHAVVSGASRGCLGGSLLGTCSAVLVGI